MSERARNYEAFQLDKSPSTHRSGNQPPTEGRDAEVYSFRTGKKMSPEEILAHNNEVAKARAEAIEKAEEENSLDDTDMKIMMERLKKDEIENREILRCVDEFRSSPSNTKEEDVIKIISALVNFDLVNFSPHDYLTANDSRRLFGLRKSARQNMRTEIIRNLDGLVHLLKD